MKYTITTDFTAKQFVFERPQPDPQTKDYKKGDKIEASEQSDFGNQMHLVSDDGFDIQKENVTEDKSGIQDSSIDFKSIFTFKNVMKAAVIIGILSLVVKATKTNP